MTRTREHRAMIAAVEALCDNMQNFATSLVEQVLQDAVNKWSKEYPRHQFRAAIGHGGIVLDVAPAIGPGMATDPRWIDPRHRLRKEAYDLEDLLLEIDDAARSNGFGDTDWITHTL